MQTPADKRIVDAVQNDSNFFQILIDNLYDGVYYLDHERTITFWNKGAERMTGYDRREVVGRKCSDDILAHMDNSGSNLCVLACPARQAIDEGKDREVELYVRHKEGHRIPVRVHITPIRDAAGKVVGAVQVFSDNYPKMELRKRLEDLQRQALLDPLTRLANRKGVEMYLKSRLGELQRFNWPFGVLFIDIDHFKHINDAFGHLIGDDVLRMVARSLLRSSRPFDIVGRWGGEEFLAIVANVDEKELTAIGERYRTVVYKSRLKRPAGIVRVSVSIGGTLCRKSDSLERLIERADGLMYRCKNAGRNCIRVAG